MAVSRRGTEHWMAKSTLLFVLHTFPLDVYWLLVCADAPTPAFPFLIDTAEDLVPPRDARPNLFVLCLGVTRVVEIGLKRQGRRKAQIGLRR